MIVLILGINRSVYAQKHNSIEEYIIEPLNEVNMDDISIFFVDEVYTEQEISQLSTDNLTENAIELNNIQKEVLLSNPVYVPTLKRVKDLLENGIEVRKVVFNVDYDLYEECKLYNTYSSIPSEYNQDSYWKKITKPLGTYNGFDFRYVQSVISIETNYKPVGATATSTPWSTILKYGLEFSVKEVIASKSQIASQVFMFSDFISGLPKPDISFSYTYGNSQYLKYKLDGNLVTRDIFMSDKNDKVYGYAYYNWGYTQWFKNYITLDARWPISSTDFRKKSGVLGYFTKYTPGYYGNITLYKNLIKYYNMTGYQAYTENINTTSAVLKHLKSTT